MNWRLESFIVLVVVVYSSTRENNNIILLFLVEVVAVFLFKILKLFQHLYNSLLLLLDISSKRRGDGIDVKSTDITCQYFLFHHCAVATQKLIVLDRVLRFVLLINLLSLKIYTLLLSSVGNASVRRNLLLHTEEILLTFQRSGNCILLLTVAQLLVSSAVFIDITRLVTVTELPTVLVN